MTEKIPSWIKLFLRSLHDIRLAWTIVSLPTIFLTIASLLWSISNQIKILSMELHKIIPLPVGDYVFFIIWTSISFAFFLKLFGVFWRKSNLWIYLAMFQADQQPYTRKELTPKERELYVPLTILAQETSFLMVNYTLEAYQKLGVANKELEMRIRQSIKQIEKQLRFISKRLEAY